MRQSREASIRRRRKAAPIGGGRPNWAPQRPRRRGTRFALPRGSAITAPVGRLPLRSFNDDAAKPRGVNPPQAESRPHWGRTPKTKTPQCEIESATRPPPEGRSSPDGRFALPRGTAITARVFREPTVPARRCGKAARRQSAQRAESRPHWGRTPKSRRRNAKSNPRSAPRPKGVSRRRWRRTPGIRRRVFALNGTSVLFIRSNARLQNALNR